ncbi:hypothetical protein NIE88_12795 [Sporolactobacillus shoreicorticis]|uniref:Uncharacterized protein n=1 Tax=Sporolactobacillus shoreicorticis TaxID=1923877 RepID=A0ABW5S7Q6_9BACL|nr:hypothetical protein [Sporolactobacillus shoreicorticis]MCO7126643.1 hypothetical protein [Sporolactobacillus shoreicorticis]
MDTKEEIYYYTFYFVDNSKLDFAKNEYEGYDPLLTLSEDKKGWLELNGTYIRLENIKYVQVETAIQREERLNKKKENINKFLKSY